MVELESDPDRTLVGPHDPLLGTVVGQRYRLDFRLAVGGFGAVYQATELPTGAAVAVKVLHDHYMRVPEVLARFRREAETLARLRDPHTVTAYGHGETARGVPWLAMELLAGESLYERFTAHGPLPWPVVVEIAREVCSSLAEAHALGVVHRDLKPANIHLERRGDAHDFVKVIDFGIAKVQQEVAFGELELTQVGQMIGTFDYMSPEQLVGGACTAASDLYTLGVVMYEMIAGVRPFPDANGPAMLLATVLGNTPPPLSAHRGVPDELDAIVARCLAREPRDRFASAAELAAALEALVHDPYEDEITHVVIMPRLPVPPPPAPVFEARGSEPMILRPDLGHERVVRWFAWMLVVIVATVIGVAFAATL